MSDDPRAIAAAALAAVGSEPRGTGRGYLVAPCPLARWRHDGLVDRNPSFGVVIDPKRARQRAGHAHCLSCGYSGDLSDVAAVMLGYGALTPEQYETAVRAAEALSKIKAALVIAPELVDPILPDATLDSFVQIDGFPPEARAYLSARGWNRALGDRCAVRWDPIQGRIVFPVRDRVGRLRGMIGRLVWDTNAPRYWFYRVGEATFHGCTWWGEQDVDPAKPIVVVEGVFDRASVLRVYPNVVAALSVGFRFPTDKVWWTAAPRWVSMFDTGKGGAIATERLNWMLKKHGATVYPAALAPGRKDPGEMTPEELRASLRSVMDRRLSLR